MDRIKELTELIAVKEAELKPLKKELNKIWLKQAEDIENKIKRCLILKDKFELEDLRFARVSRCHCGAGMAYPKDAGPRSAWYCSAILTGTADVKVEHSPELPFTFYEVKSETKEQTTRP